MKSWKQILLAAYYYGNLPRRKRAGARRAAQAAAPAIILFYHRVADAQLNAWTISTANFLRQIDWLGEHFPFVSLAEAQARIRSGSNARPTVSITFDDGYADNCRAALPYLIEHKIPVTYFVTSGNAVSGAPFPHDLQAGVPLQPNSIAQLRDLAAAGIEIGAHTRSHCDLGKVTDPLTLRDEIVTARDELAQRLAAPIHHFAFPYGHPQNTSAAAFAMARAGGYRGVCTAYGGYNFPGGDGFHLARIHGDPELLRLKNWLSLDPRKLRASRQRAAELPDLVHCDSHQERA